MINNSLNDKDEILRHYEETSPKALIQCFESLADKLWDLGDIRSNPGVMFRKDVQGIVTEHVMEMYENQLNTVDYGDETQVMESYETGLDTQVLGMTDVHKSNLRQLLENSAGAVRQANPNQFNLNELTPFDAFLPFVIIRSYLPLIGKDLMPTITPSKPWIRIKQEYKYVVTKDGKKYLRPDIYNDTDKAQEILDTARGARVTQAWYPAATELTSEQIAALTGSEAVITEGTKKYQLPEALEINAFDLLQASGGNTQIGDDLDIDVCVNGIRAVVEHEGETHIIEQVGYHAYADITSITPQRSISFPVTLNIKDSSDNIIATYTDTIYGDYDGYTRSFNLVSLKGYVKQVQFDGHMSNKNNLEYFSFTRRFGEEQHPIPEGFKSNVPITHEDMQLYKESASIDIVATTINEMTETFTQFEDSSIIGKIDSDFALWKGKGEGDHPFEHFHGKVVFEKEVSVLHDSTRLLKRNEVVQDEIQYAVARFIGEMRNVILAEPFKVVAFCHPNIASLFVGNNIDWKVTPGTGATEGIRTDYNMGIYTANGDSFRIITSMKLKEADGVRFLIFPVNEQNFLSWKHFKHSIFFSREYRNAQMDLVPNIMGCSQFYTHSYTPLQAKLYIKDWK